MKATFKSCVYTDTCSLCIAYASRKFNQSLLCIELPNQKTIIYFTRKKIYFSLFANLVVSHPSTDFPPSAKFIPKYIAQLLRLITILIYLRVSPPQGKKKVNSLASFTNKLNNPSLLHMSSFILTGEVFNQA